MEKRSFEIDVGSIRAESRTVQASLSSEFPVQRYDGEEILKHTPEAVDLSRAPLPLLRAHDNTALPVGVVEGLSVSNGKLKGIIRLSANEDGIWQDIQDGILRNLSIGYKIITRIKNKNGYLATKWQPYEVSLVAAPADNTVGIGRNYNNLDKKENKKMDRNDILKSKKAAVEEMAELAKSGENAERLEELKGEIRAFDSRLEALDIADKAKKDQKATFTPDIKKENRSIIEITGGPATNRTFAGMFNNGRKLEVNEEEIRAFRASMIEGSIPSGGASVPEPLAAKWLDDSIESEIIRPRATVWPMESATRKIPGWDVSDQSTGAMFGGFAMEFLPETGTGTPQVGKLRTIELTAKKGAIFAEASNELVEDGLGFDAQLDRAMKGSIGYGMDDYFINGVGAPGEPRGLRYDPAKITVAKGNGQLADTIIFANLSNMYARMYPAGRNRAVWLANSTAITQLIGLTIGTTSAYVPAMTEVGGKFYILGREVLFNSHMPVVGDEDDLMFVDLSQYAIGIRRDMKLEKSNIPGWSQDLMSYRALLRFDGMGTWNAPITPKNGDTMSWCVGLAERGE